MRLPKGWDTAIDPSTSLAYYFNRSTGETSWLSPTLPEMSVNAAAVYIQKTWRAKQARARIQTMMHSVYRRIFDPTTQAYFYHNVKTGETSWMTPRGLKIKPKTSPNEGIEDSLDDTTELPEGWTEAFDTATQHTYYVNEKTRETSWTKPHFDGSWKPFSLNENDAAILMQAAWRGRCDRVRVRELILETTEMVTDPATGKATYYNKRTNSSSKYPSRLPLIPSQKPRFGEAPPSKDESESSERKLRIGVRLYPRSKAQKIVDAAEDMELDNIPAIELNLSNLQALKLSSRIWNLDNLERLELNNNRLLRIPSGIQDLTKLVYLDVSHNALTTLPSGLQTTLTLKYLDASHNYITTFSPRLWKIKSLTELNLSYNHLEEMPYIEGDLKLLKETGAWGVGIGLLIQLQSLKINHNRLRIWPMSLENCTALSFLDMSHNELEILSDDVGNLKQLEVLNIHNNSLKKLPDTIGSLGKLREFFVSNNQLSDIPPRIEECSQLTILDISNNKMRALRVEIKSVISLNHLLLAGNPLSHFPNHLHDMNELQILNVSHCQLQSLPDNVWKFSSKKAQLSTFDGSHNELEILPITALEVLLLSHNQITVVPDEIIQLSKLRVLQLQHNNLTKLPQLLGQLALLDYLDVSHNKLSNLPSTCNKLKRLNSNPFETIDADLQAFLDAVYQAKLDVDKKQYETAYEVFSKILFDVKIRPLAVLNETHKHIRATAFFYRGICRYQQISGALNTLGSLNEEAVSLMKVIHEDIMIHEYDAHRPRQLQNKASPPTKYPDEITSARTRLAEVIQCKDQHRASISEWKNDAITDLKAALRLNMEPATASYTLSMLYSKLGEYPRAVHMWTKAIEYLQGFQQSKDENVMTMLTAPLIMERARSYARMGQIPQALVDYNTILSAFPQYAEAQLEANEWTDHQKKYHEPCGVDSDELLRAYNIDIRTGICRRHYDPSIDSLPPSQLNEIDAKERFLAECQNLRDEIGSSQAKLLISQNEAKAKREALVSAVLDRKREIRSNLTMAKEEEDQRKRDEAIAHALYLNQVELAREANERIWLQYEEDLQRWVEQENDRLRLEELEALEAARRKAEEKEEHKKRLARRGGLRQAASTRAKAGK
ncbi:hypothetical protein THRCLA_21933 [Thraustotheca clavata]|uniref:WW domain-containing protein n=1 Tax=Thraustotheca clavata TaxID=74557 RepID=A0A1V9ZHH7_9STRA|nr:hypothetical protein THRCLA_21933 [Thraustotheca clavata]